MDNTAIIKELILEEGTRLFAYDDATGEPIVPGYVMVGHPTIGTGRDLDRHGLSGAEAQFLLDDDLAAIEQALKIYPWWLDLNAARQFVIVSMVFNMGVRGMLGFRKMIAALNDGGYSVAASEMLASKWGVQLPARSHRLAQIMQSGVLLP